MNFHIVLPLVLHDIRWLLHSNILSVCCTVLINSLHTMDLSIHKTRSNKNLVVNWRELSDNFQLFVGSIVLQLMLNTISVSIKTFYVIRMIRSIILGQKYWTLCCSGWFVANLHFCWERCAQMWFLNYLDQIVDVDDRKIWTIWRYLPILTVKSTKNCDFLDCSNFNHFTLRALSPLSLK